MQAELPRRLDLSGRASGLAKPNQRTLYPHRIPCIERCAFGVVKSWTGYLIVRNEAPANRRVDLDTTITAMALTSCRDGLRSPTNHHLKTWRTRQDSNL
jgi:hypothetical protein